MLNIFHILAKYSSSRTDSIIFLLELLFPVSIKFPKGILFSCKILSDALFNRQALDAETQKKFNVHMKNLVEDDLRRVQEKNHEDFFKNVKAIEDRYQNERKPPVLAFQEQASAVSLLIPHFAIRLIDYLDREQARLGVNLRADKGLTYTDNEFLFFRSLAAHLLKVISFFRRQLYFD